MENSISPCLFSLYANGLVSVALALGRSSSKETRRAFPAAWLTPEREIDPSPMAIAQRENVMSRARVDKTHLAWLDAMKANDGRALGRLVTEDAVLMPPNEPVLVGRTAVVAWFENVVRQARTTGIDIPQREVIVTGDYGIERGSFVWKLSPASGGPPFEARGNFLAIYQRQADGEWKVIRNIWNSTLPVAVGA
jgi:ketosteroid isomerase-like protein